MRQPILYAEEMWRRQRFWALILVVVGIVMSAYALIYGHGGLRLNDPNSGWIWLLYIPSGALLAGALLLAALPLASDLDGEPPNRKPRGGSDSP